MPKLPYTINLKRTKAQKIPELSVAQEADIKRRHRFIATIMVFVILLFLIPTYQLVSSYNNLQKQKATIIKLQKEKAALLTKSKAEETLASQLNDTSYVEKYARAKYYYSKAGESIYPVPSFLP